jgi:rare lipoprotein A
MALTTLCAAQAQIRNFKQRGAATGTLGSEGLTAAHPSLPIGTFIKVTNTTNNQEVTATVTSRIPASVDRIVDLSAAAAAAIGVPGGGSVSIILERINALPQPEPVVIVEAEPEPEPEPEPAREPEPVPPPVVVAEVPTPSPPPPPPPPPPKPVVAKNPARIIPRMPDPGSTTIFRVQAGSYLLPLHAREAFERLVAAGFHPYFERFENYIRVVIPGVPAAYIPWIAQRLGALDVTEAWIRPESY